MVKRLLYFWTLMVIFGCIEATLSVYNENSPYYTPIMTLTLTFLFTTYTNTHYRVRKCPS